MAGTSPAMTIEEPSSTNAPRRQSVADGSGERFLPPFAFSHPSLVSKGDSMPARGPWIDHFGDNFLWSNATLIIKGMAPYGVVALAEMDRAWERLKVRQHEPDRGKAWKEEWS